MSKLWLYCGPYIKVPEDVMEDWGKLEIPVNPLQECGHTQDAFYRDSEFLDQKYCHNCVIDSNKTIIEKLIGEIASTAKENAALKNWKMLAKYRVKIIEELTDKIMAEDAQ